MMNWHPTSGDVPNGVLLLTKIDDRDGVRNVCLLKRSKSRLWFVPDGSMYVYYEPTHWADIGESLGDKHPTIRELISAAEKGEK